MGFFDDAFDFEKFQLDKFWDELSSHPQRILTGIDPLSTNFWNAITGSDFDPLVSQLGGATQQTFGEAEQAGIDTRSSRQLTGLAEVIAGSFATAGLGNAAGNIGGSSATGVGSDITGGGTIGSADAGAAGGGFNIGNIPKQIPGGGGGGQPSNLDFSDQLMIQQQVNAAATKLQQAQAALASAKTPEERAGLEAQVAQAQQELQSAQNALAMARAGKQRRAV